MWIIFALLSGSLAALLAILIKIHLKHFNPFFVTFLFSLITIAFLGLIDLVSNKVECKLITQLSFKEWSWLITAGLVNAIAFSCYVNALRCGKAGGVVAVDRLGIIFAIFLAAIFLQESFSCKTLIGAIIMVFGAFLVSH